MPVILGRRHFERWLDPTGQGAGALAPLLRPFSAERLRAYPVSPLVNGPRNDDPRCLEPAK
jgi:putative SOS response-associated peptidase YedK